MLDRGFQFNNADTIVKIVPSHPGSQSLCSTCQILPYRTFPDDRYAPAGFTEKRHLLAIPAPVLFELFCPEGGSRCRHRRIFATFMMMPEAAVDEHGHAIPGQYEIGRAGQIPSVKPEPKAGRMESPAQQDLGLGVPRSDARHHPRACRTVDYIRHGKACAPVADLEEGGT